MERFQRNTIKSFRRVKEDIRNLQAQITELMRMQEDILDRVCEVESKNTPKRVTRRVVRKRA
jgi:hypothetical protein